MEIDEEEISRAKIFEAISSHFISTYFNFLILCFSALERFVVTPKPEWLLQADLSQ